DGVAALVAPIGAVPAVSAANAPHGVRTRSDARAVVPGARMPLGQTPIAHGPTTYKAPPTSSAARSAIAKTRRSWYRPLNSVWESGAVELPVASACAILRQFH